MIIKAYNENHKYLLFIDLEFSNQELVQFAGLLFNRIEDDTYQLSGSVTVYINGPATPIIPGIAAENATFESFLLFAFLDKNQTPKPAPTCPAPAIANTG